MNELTMPVTLLPYNHQRRAFDFACNLFGMKDGKVKSTGMALLAEMGTGKTFITIGVTGALFNAGKIRRVLIVAPLSVLSTWQDEFEKFAAYGYELTVLKGTMEKKRKQLEAESDKLQIVVVNYESAWRMETELIRYGADLVVCDEGHKLKEGRASQSKGLHHIGDAAKYRMLLTGTVITNREVDVWSQYRFVNPQIFGTSFYAFRNRYFYMGGYGLHTLIFRKEMTDDFLHRMHCIAFRITKDECLDLPPISEEVRTIELEPKAMALYKDIQKESFAELRDGEVSAVNVLTKLLRLSQITGGHVTDDAGNVNTVSTAKLDALSDIVDAALANGQKLVIMARFVAELDDIAALLEKKHIAYATVRGGVKDRGEEVRRFQEDPECMMFVGQITAAGVGITLTAAATMVFYSLNYNMSDFEQAKARIHRVSQTRNVHYIYLIAKGTVDRRVLRSLRDKVDLAKTLVDDYRKGRNPYEE